MIIKPKGGVNLRLPAYETPENQFFLMQNFDMTHQEEFHQIKGSVKYHGATIGTNAPTAIIVNYNQTEDRQDVLVAVDDKIMKKNFGSNEFETLYQGLTPGSVRFAVNIDDKSYIASPKDGLFEFDGISKIRKLTTNTSLGTSIMLKDIIYSKETNRCFGITTENELVWTDALSSSNLGGVPIVWAGANVDTQAPTLGDVPEKLAILDGRLVILRTNSIYFYYILGGPTDWRPEKLNFTGGCIAPKTVKQVGKEIWFLGYSPENGRGVYGLDGGGNVRLLSYDIEPFLDRINESQMTEACAEYVDNLYKLSVAADSSSENNYTFHFDTINVNTDTGVPNIYGPHTYGFSASAVLNTRRFKGEHLFAKKHTDGARVFKVANYRTQHSDEMQDNGDLIPTVLMSGIIAKETYGKSLVDETWFKRYSNIFVDFPPQGTWSGQIEILKGYENETFLTYDQYLEDSNYSVEALDLDSDPVEFKALGSSQILADFESDSIQLKFSNYNVNTRAAFRSMRYEVTPSRRKKHVDILSL